MIAVYSRERGDHTISQPVLIGHAEVSTGHAEGTSGNPDPNKFSVVLINWRPAGVSQAQPTVDRSDGIARVRPNATALDHYFLMAMVRSFGGQVSVSYPEMDEAVYGQMNLIHEKTDSGLYIARVTGDPRNEG
jgi:hypothetical protein